MEQEQEKQQIPPPLPVIPRLDRLDRLLQHLEEKHSQSRRHVTSPVVPKMEAVPDDPSCKALSSALEEVHQKGTLMDRIEMLEDRILQLSLEMDGRNTSRSSSSTSLVAEENGQGSCTRLDDQDVTITLQDKQEPLEIRASLEAESCSSKPQSCSAIRGRPKKLVSTMHYRKWIGCFQIRC